MQKLNIFITTFSQYPSFDCLYLKKIWSSCPRFISIPLRYCKSLTFIGVLFFCTYQPSKVSHTAVKSGTFGSFPKMRSLHRTWPFDTDTVLNATPPKTYPIKAITKKHPLGGGERERRWAIPGSHQGKNTIYKRMCVYMWMPSQPHTRKHSFSIAPVPARELLGVI